MGGMVGHHARDKPSQLEALSAIMPRYGKKPNEANAIHTKERDIVC